MEKVSAGRGHTVEQAAAHLFLSQTRFYELVAEGVIPRANRRGYRLDTVRRAYFRHLRTAPPVDASLVRERALLTRERTTSAQIKNAASFGDYVLKTVVKNEIATTFAGVRTKALAIVKVAPAIEMRSRDEVETALHVAVIAALDKMSEG